MTYRIVGLRRYLADGTSFTEDILIREDLLPAELGRTVTADARSVLGQLDREEACDTEPVPSASRRRPARDSLRPGYEFAVAAHEAGHGVAAYVEGALGRSIGLRW